MRPRIIKESSGSKRARSPVRYASGSNGAAPALVGAAGSTRSMRPEAATSAVACAWAVARCQQISSASRPESERIAGGIGWSFSAVKAGAPTYAV